MTGTLYTPLRVERAALAALRPVRTGLGLTRAAAARRPGPALVAGVGGALAAGIAPGDLVVADQVRGPDGSTVPCPSAPLLAGALGRLGHTVHIGPVVSAARVVDGAARRDLAATGALAVDLESAALVSADRPSAVVRSIVDTLDHPLWSLATAGRGLTALRRLRRAGPALLAWDRALGPREVVRAAPRWWWSGRAPAVDLLLVVGRLDPSDARRLVEAAGRAAVPAPAVDAVGDIELGWLADAARVGVTAGASAPPALVDQVVSALSGLGPVTVHQPHGATGDFQFTLSREVS